MCESDVVELGRRIRGPRRRLPDEVVASSGRDARSEHRTKEAYVERDRPLLRLLGDTLCPGRLLTSERVAPPAIAEALPITCAPMRAANNPKSGRSAANAIEPPRIPAKRIRNIEIPPRDPRPLFGEAARITHSRSVGVEEASRQQGALESLGCTPEASSGSSRLVTLNPTRLQEHAPLSPGRITLRKVNGAETPMGGDLHHV